MSISNDNVSIVVNPATVAVYINEDSQLIRVVAESIIVQTNELLTSSGTDVYVIGEIPNGAINGSNATFTTLQNFVPLSVELVLNSTIQTYGIDYYTTGVNTIIMNVSPVIGDIIRVNYKLG
jgi:hypothetical protein